MCVMVLGVKECVSIGWWKSGEDGSRWRSTDHLTRSGVRRTSDVAESRRPVNITEGRIDDTRPRSDAARRASVASIVYSMRPIVAHPRITEIRASSAFPSRLRGRYPAWFKSPKARVTLFPVNARTKPARNLFDTTCLCPDDRDSLPRKVLPCFEPDPVSEPSRHLPMVAVKSSNFSW
jgi:hypothetical protein